MHQVILLLLHDLEGDCIVAILDSLQAVSTPAPLHTVPQYPKCLQAVTTTSPTYSATVPHTQACGVLWYRLVGYGGTVAYCGITELQHPDADAGAADSHLHRRVF